MPLVAGAAAAGLVIVALVVWGLVRRSEPPPAAAPTTTASQPAAPSAPAPAPPPAPTPAPEPAQPPAAAARAPVPAATRPTAPAAPPLAAAATEPPRKGAPAPRKGIREVRNSLNSIPTPTVASGDGVLSIDATPWALVWLDGKDLGETPIELRLGAGTYRLRATHPELGGGDQSVTIAAGKRRSIAVKFK
jgi:hypothetical protein